MSTVNWDNAALNDLLEGPDGAVAHDLLKRGIRVERTAKRFCPVDTGRARASITHEMGRDSRGLFVKIGSNVHYFKFIELGTRFMRAFAPLRKALRSAR